MNIFFDLDGPILDIKLRYYELYRKFILMSDGTSLDIDTYWDLKKEGVSLGEILKKGGVSDRLEGRYRVFLTENREKDEYLELDRLHKNVSNVLEKLSKENDLYLVTLRRNKENLHRQLSNLGIMKYFKEIISEKRYIDEGWRIKINLIKDKNLDLSNGYFIGDTETDVLTGRNLGLKTIAISTGIRSKERLINLNPDYLIDDIKEITNIIK